MNRNLASALAIAGTAAAAVALAAISAGKAYADDITIDNTPFVSSRSRAEVQAELLGQADVLRAAASEWSLQSNQPPRVQSAYTSAQAQAEYKASRDYLRALYAEDSGSAWIIKSPMPGLANDRAVMGAPAR